MKKIDWESANLTPSDSFHRAVNHALQQEEKPMKRKSFATVLITALLIVALAATALAVANRAGLFDFFEAWDNEGIPQTPGELTHLISGGSPLLEAKFDDLLITVTEAAGADEWYYYNTTIELAPGVPGRVVCVDMAYDQYIDDGYTEPTYFVRSYMLHERAINSSGDWRMNDDGSISALTVLDMMEASDMAQMYCYITYVKAEPGTLPIETETQMAYLPFTMPTVEPDRASRLLMPADSSSEGIRYDEVALVEVGGKTYCYVYMRFDGGESADYRIPTGRLGWKVRLTNGDTDEVITDGFSLNWVQDNMFYGYTLVEPESWPNALRAELVGDVDEADSQSHQAYGVALLELQDGRPDETSNAVQYRTSPLQAPDYRDMYFAWSDMSFASEHAYVNTEDARGVPVYANPNDASTLIGYYASGLEVRPNITFKEWTSIAFGDANSTETKGYIMSENLTRDAQDDRSHIPTATPAGSMAHCDVRIRPLGTSTICAKIDAGESIYLIGTSADGWYQVGREDEYGMRILGYVPSEALITSK